MSINIFEENENHACRIETRMVKFNNSPEVDASKINFSDEIVMAETIKEVSAMGILSPATTGETP